MYQGIDFAFFRLWMKPILLPLKCSPLLCSTIKVYKVLDALKIIDEFYLNVLDYGPWYKAITLFKELYFMNTVSNHQNGLLLASPLNENFNSVCWNYNTSQQSVIFSNGNTYPRLWGCV